MTTRSLANRIGTCTALVVVTMVSSAAFAHHGWGSYDATKTLTLTGAITESSYVNPHGQIRLNVEGEKNWLVVLAPPSRMKSRGLSAEMLNVGKTATVVGYPHKQVADEMRAERITVDGKTTELR